MNLKITISTNLTNVNFLDFNLDLESNKHKPFHKPNEKLKYINIHSNHPKIVFNNLVPNISTKISALSSNKNIFDNAALYYNKALEDSKFKDQIYYIDKNDNKNTTKKF